MKHRILSLLLPMTALTMGCGADPEPRSDLDPTTDEVAFVGDLTAAGEQSVAIIGHVADVGRVGLSYQWEQLDGPSVFIANPKGSVLAFEMPTESVQFRLTITDDDGDAITGEVNIAPDGVYEGCHVQRDHEVIQGNDVSLRLSREHAIAHVMAQDPALTEEEAYDQVSEMTRNITWQQVEGPLVDMDVENPERVLFQAPMVDEDAVLVFDVEEDIDGQTYRDRAYVHVNHHPLVQPSTGVVALVRAYRPDSQWRDALYECVYSQHVAAYGLCDRSRLPLLGQEAGGVPSIDQIMNRVVVSHDWMGQRFEEFLRDRDPYGDFRTLMSSVSAIILSYDVRPSYYSGATTAIHLDPNNLWLTPEERDTLNEAPDYRSSFGNDLQFLVLWRYVKDDEYAYSYPSLARRVERTWDQVDSLLASLLYHELAHATDYFPPSSFDILEGNTYIDALEARVDGLLSDDLTARYSLASDEMFALARVRYRGEEATPEQSAYSPEDVATFYPPDRASAFYSYTSEREDLAMLFEEVMMSHRYGVLRDTAITDVPPELSASTVMVAWGQRGRASEPQLAARAAHTIDIMLPDLDGAAIVESLPEMTPMRAGESWLDNLTLTAPQKRSHARGDRPLEFEGARYGHWHAHGRH